MKVICIDNTNENEECPTPVLGDAYTVINETRFAGYDFYEFYEIPFKCGTHYWYLKSRFIPISSIDETTFERNYNKELA